MEYAEELMDFFEEQGFKMDPRPEIILDKSAKGRFDPFISTGHYEPDNMTITLYVSNRQAKDIMRTLAHELVHHHQNLKDPEGFSALYKGGKLTDNPELARYEQEAYAKGNMTFREWTEDQE